MEEAGSQASSEGTRTETITLEKEDEVPESPTLRLKLRKPKSDKKVQWTTETVDNEDMGKKKSKCCCIYEKPKLFGESSSSEDEDETEHCHGHKKKCYRHGGGQNHSHDHNHDHGGAGPGEGPSGEPGPGPSSSSGQVS